MPLDLVSWKHAGKRYFGLVIGSMCRTHPQGHYMVGDALVRWLDKPTVVNIANPNSLTYHDTQAEVYHG